MEHRKLLDEYYKYLGKDRPVNKMITNHLLFFADWLDIKEDQQKAIDTGEEK